MTDPRCVCGYPRAFHALGSLLCPDPSSGKKPKYRPAPPPAEPVLWREVMRREARARTEAIEAARRPYEPPPVLPPQVPARPPVDAGELASYQGKQALGLGRLAFAAGWRVGNYYWRGHDGTEGCAVTLAMADMRAVGTWKRPPGNLGAASGWKADVAYAWRLGEMPRKCNHTDLEMIFRD